MARAAQGASAASPRRMACIAQGAPPEPPRGRGHARAEEGRGQHRHTGAEKGKGRHRVLWSRGVEGAAASRVGAEEGRGRRRVLQSKGAEGSVAPALEQRRGAPLDLAVEPLADPSRAAPPPRPAGRSRYHLGRQMGSGERVCE
jgi:hypothetical protein